MSFKGKYSKMVNKKRKHQLLKSCSPEPLSQHQPHLVSFGEVKLKDNDILHWEIIKISYAKC